MRKKIVAVVLGITLFASPALVLAQTPATSQASLVAELTQLIQLLEQELQELIALHSGASNINFSSSSASGAAPLTVTFMSFGDNVSGDSVNFGDGSSGTPTQCSGSQIACSQVVHTYQSAGTYNAILLSSSGAVLGSQTITVTGSVAIETSFTATPTSGAAALTVNFTALAAALTPGVTYTVNFGDGSSGTISLPFSLPAGGCDQGVSCSATVGTSHIYQSAGTYTAQLVSPCSGRANCQVLGTVTITVSGSQQQTTFSANPTSGPAPLAVTFNATGLNSGASYNVNFGDGTNGTISIPFPDCLAGSSSCTGANFGGNVSHTYTSAGTYTAQLVSPCSGGANCQVLGTATVTVASATFNPTFTVTSGSSGTAPYGVNFSVTNGSNNDIINFGDGTQQNINGAGSNTIHTYQSTGTYTATLEQSDGAPYSNTPAITITVTGGTSAGGTCSVNGQPVQCSSASSYRN